MSFFSKFLDSNEKEVNKLSKIVKEINAWEDKIVKLSDSALKGKTAEFKKRLEKGETLDNLLPEAYASVREAAKRAIGQRHYDVQLVAGVALHQGKIAEQRTGEGKTLSATTAIYLNALTGKGVHVITVNDYLAKRDAEWMSPIFTSLGASVGYIVHEIDPGSEQRRAMYAADITYGTNNEFGFDYLRDNMVSELGQMVQRGHNFAIVDEVDSILIDEARTPLIISAPSDEATEKYYDFAKLVGELSADTDYVIDEKLKTANLTEHGIAKIEKKLGVENLYEKDFSTVHHIQQALKARTLFQIDRDYVVREGEVIIVDEFTGRLMIGRRYSEGLHQAIEAKENVQIQQESRTLATISFQNYFRLYKKLAGMTGTALTEAEEFHKIYNLEVVSVPTHRPLIREDTSDVVYKTAKVKYTAVANEVAQKNADGRPVLIGTTSIEKNEFLSELLKRKGIKHEVLNAKNHAREAEIISQAGRKNAVTLATNIAGRGVDIILGGKPPEKGTKAEIKNWEKLHEEVIELGGLHVVGTERHESRRIDNQLRGRSGRQGDPGSSQFYVSLEDDIMRLFGGEQIAKLMSAMKLPEDTPIQHAMVSKAIENAQVKVEGHNFDMRKHLVDYDDVMNKQREIIYARRRQILEAQAGDADQQNQLKESILQSVRDEVQTLVNVYIVSEEPNIDQLVKEFATIVPFDEDSQKRLKDDLSKNLDQVAIQDNLISLVEKIYQTREEQLGLDNVRQIERFVSLSVIDNLWMDHLDTIDDLREGIGLRGYAQRDPLVEYKKEAFDLFEKLVASIDSEIAHRIFHVQIQQQPIPVTVGPIVEQGAVEAPTTQVESKPTDIEPDSDKDPMDLNDDELEAEIARLERLESTGQTESSEVASNPAIVADQKIGRNDPCPCGSGLKWKKCGLINAPEHKG